MSPHVLYFSRLDGYVGRIDTRSNTDAELYALSEKKIGGFSIHPQYPHYLATASLDRFMRVWDLRKISGKGEEKMPVMVGEHLSNLSVSHAAFNAVGQVATASYDDTIKIHSFEGMGNWTAGTTLSGESMKPKVIRHNNQTGRWVTMHVLTLFLCIQLWLTVIIQQFATSMATIASIPHPTFLYRKYESFRGHLYRRRRSVSATRWRGRNCSTCRGAVPSNDGLGGRRDGEWEVVSVDVRV